MIQNILRSLSLAVFCFILSFIQADAQDLSNLNPESVTYRDSLSLPDVNRNNLKSFTGEKLLDSVYFYNPDSGISTWQQTQSTLYRYNAGNLLSDKISRYWSDQKSLWEEFLKRETSYSLSGLKIEEGTKAWSTARETWENRKRDSYTYDSLSQLSHLVTAYWRSDSLYWNDSIKYSYEFDAEGNWIMYLRETRISESQSWRKDYRFLFSYENGNKTLLLRQNYRTDIQDWVNSNKIVYTYDLQNRLIAETGDVWDADSSKWDPNSRIKYLYNETGKLSDKIYKSWTPEGWSHYARYNYSWDEQGNNTNIVYSTWVADKNLWEENTAYQYEYDEDRDLIREIWKDFNSQNSDWESTFRIDYFYSLSTYKKETNVARLSVFPNPFINDLTIDIEKDFLNPEPVRILITDLNGKILLTRLLESSEITLSGLNLPSGIYLFGIQYGNQIFYRKIIKE